MGKAQDERSIRLFEEARPLVRTHEESFKYLLEHRLRVPELPHRSPPHMGVWYYFEGWLRQQYNVEVRDPDFPAAPFQEPLVLKVDADGIYGSFESFRLPPGDFSRQANETILGMIEDEGIRAANQFVQQTLRPQIEDNLRRSFAAPDSAYVDVGDVVEHMINMRCLGVHPEDPQLNNLEVGLVFPAPTAPQALEYGCMIFRSTFPPGRSAHVVDIMQGSYGDSPLYQTWKRFVQQQLGNSCSVNKTERRRSV